MIVPREWHVRKIYGPDLETMGNVSSCLIIKEISCLHRSQKLKKPDYVSSCVEE